MSVVQCYFEILIHCLFLDKLNVPHEIEWDLNVRMGVEFSTATWLG